MKVQDCAWLRASPGEDFWRGASQWLPISALDLLTLSSPNLHGYGLHGGSGPGKGQWRGDSWRAGPHLQVGHLEAVAMASVVHLLFLTSKLTALNVPPDRSGSWAENSSWVGLGGRAQGFPQPALVADLQTQ